VVRPLIAVILACLSVLMTAPVASALTVVKEELEEGYYEFTGEPCGIAIVRVFLPVKARSIEVSEPNAGDPVHNDRGEEIGRLSDVTIDRSGRRPKVIWTGEPTPLGCTGPGWEAATRISPSIIWFPDRFGSVGPAPGTMQIAP
jgi:hypothetical protein